MFCFSIFLFCRSFLICNSNLTFHPGFDFLSAVFRGTTIFSQTNFAPANSLILWCCLLEYLSIGRLLFSVSVLTVLQSWFLREGNVVLSSGMILFRISTFIFPSWVSFTVVVFAVFLPLSFSVWFWLSFLFSCIQCHCYCIRGLLICLPIYLFVYFQYFKVSKQTILYHCPNLIIYPWFVFLNLANSV